MTTGIPFRKMNGLGNEILVVDLRGRGHAFNGAAARKLRAAQNGLVHGLQALLRHDVAERLSRSQATSSKRPQFPYSRSTYPTWSWFSWLTTMA